MSLLKDLASDASIANEKDSVGGGGVVDSGLYPADVTLAYVTVSAGGAKGLVFQAKTEHGRDIKQTLWMTSGKAKGGTNFYTDKDGGKQYLPGFIAANALALLTCGKEISELDTEEKVVKVYDYTAKAEIPTKVQMITEMLGKKILIGVIKQIVDKSKKDDAGNYVPTGETREENEIDKFFRASDRKTTTEIRGQAEASFVDTWEAKFTGTVRDKSGKGGVAGKVGAPGAAAANQPKVAKPATSLFG